ncbi:hypothetical protein HP532_08215 [Pseudomonas sp. CrR25]|nr:hypothetical protein [Pseudomonas sp. CrR25]
MHTQFRLGIDVGGSKIATIALVAATQAGTGALLRSTRPRPGFGINLLAPQVIVLGGVRGATLD